MSRLLFLALVASASALKLPEAATTRRATLQSLAAATLLPSLPAFAIDKEAAKTVTDTQAALKKLLGEKDAFVAALAAGEDVSVPAPIPFTIFQKLEKTSEPEFMEAAIDYAEAYRGVKDLVKLAKLTKQPVVVSTKEKGQPRKEETIAYGDAPGSGLASAEEYAKRAVNEALGASLALDAAIGFMK